MKTLTVSGSSDDLITTDGLPGCDEFNVNPKGAYAGKLIVKSKKLKVEITIHCIYDGHWCFAIGPNDGDYDEMPDWPIRRRWGELAAYSELVEIDCPDDATLKLVEPE